MTLQKCKINVTNVQADVILHGSLFRSTKYTKSNFRQIITDDCKLIVRLTIRISTWLKKSESSRFRNHKSGHVYCVWQNIVLQQDWHEVTTEYSGPPNHFKSCDVTQHLERNTFRHSQPHTARRVFKDSSRQSSIPPPPATQNSMSNPTVIRDTLNIKPKRSFIWELFPFSDLNTK